MAASKFETEKFNGKNNFGIWRIKMKALLVQQGLAAALGGEDRLPASLSTDARETLLEKAHNTIILCLSDKVVREVARETSAASVWMKLESLYMTKSFTNRLFMKQKLYAYKITEDRSMEDQIDEFNKALDDLENLDVKLDDEDKAILLLNALPKSYDHLKDAMLYGRENSISLEEVQSALKGKELQKSSNGQPSSSTHESLNVKQKFNKNWDNNKKPASDFKKSSQFKSKDLKWKEST